MPHIVHSTWTKLQFVHERCLTPEYSAALFAVECLDGAAVAFDDGFGDGEADS